MAANELDRLGINPIEEALKCVQQLDDLINKNVKAFESMRGFSDRADSGTQYLANALRGVSEKSAIYMTLAKFKYPTLSAVALKDYTEEKEDLRPINTQEAMKIINSDPFKEHTKKVVDSITEVRNIQVLPKGSKDE